MRVEERSHLSTLILAAIFMCCLCSVHVYTRCQDEHLLRMIKAHKNEMHSVDAGIASLNEIKNPIPRGE